MADTREAILRRLEKIAVRVAGISNVTRMTPDINTEDGATLAIFDGGEQRDGESRIAGAASATFTMRPEFHIFLAAQATDIGKAVNKIRAAAIKAVVFDADLLDLTGPNGRVQYLGCDVDASRGAAVEADMALIFAITYVLHPQLL